MNVLFTGKGTSGSWQCRGAQLGGQIGTAVPLASLEECRAADIIVVVKRINHGFFKNVIKSGTPWVWDLVDFFPQPLAGTWPRARAIKWVQDQIKQAKPAGVIYPNAKMKEDIGIPGEVIYHHARPAPLNPIRQSVKTVGYEGSPKFLGKWRDVLLKECAWRGWKFVEGAPLHEVDVVVALRDGDHNGYVQKNWKSNVKLANAHGTGTPFVGMTEWGYVETATGMEEWVSTPKDISKSFDILEMQETRQAIHKAFVANTFTLQSRAAQLKRYLESLKV